MGSVLHIVRQGIEGLLWPFDKLPPFLALSLLSVLTGIVLLWLVKKTSPQKLVERARDQMTAAIYEIRLYLDNPLRVLAAQGRLIRWSFWYVGAMMPALLAAALPLGLLYLHLETRYGLTGIEPGVPVVVRVDLADAIDGSDLTAEGHEGLEVSADAQVYEKKSNAVFLRVKATDTAAHDLSITVSGTTVKKRIAVRGSGERAAPDRLSGAGLLWQIGDESPLSGPVEGISLVFPESTRSWLGLPWWWAYWLLLATLAALLLRKKMDVAI